MSLWIRLTLVLGIAIHTNSCLSQIIPPFENINRSLFGKSCYLGHYIDSIKSETLNLGFIKSEGLLDVWRVYQTGDTVLQMVLQTEGGSLKSVRYHFTFGNVSAHTFFYNSSELLLKKSSPVRENTFYYNSSGLIEREEVLFKTMMPGENFKRIVVLNYLYGENQLDSMVIIDLIPQSILYEKKFVYQSGKLIRETVVWPSSGGQNESNFVFNYLNGRLAEVRLAEDEETHLILDYDEEGRIANERRYLNGDELGWTSFMYYPDKRIIEITSFTKLNNEYSLYLLKPHED